MAARKITSSGLILLIAVFLLGSGWFSAQAGVFPILGVLVALFAPNIFLLGFVLLAIGLVRLLPINKFVAVLPVVVLSIAMGLNTRLPTLLSDYRHGSMSESLVLSRFAGPVGQPLHIVTSASEILARHDPYSHAKPASWGDGGFVTKGFRTPYPWMDRRGDYWHEKVVDVVLATGFSKANEGERAPTLTVVQESDGDLSNLSIELADADGKRLAYFSGRYRNGLPNETKDGKNYDGREARPLVFEYLLHGNLINWLAETFLPRGEPYPLRSFLAIATSLAHPQGSQLRDMGWIGGAASSARSMNVPLEIIEEKTYNPVWVIKEDPKAKRSKWSELSWDSEQEKRCAALLRPEMKDTPLNETWFLFVNDPSGRKKVKYSGNTLCNNDAIWFLDYGLVRGRTVLTKYSINGDYLYRVSFENPSELGGCFGSIMSPTFKAENGYLNFEWWNSEQSGYDRLVARSMKVRLREPQAQPPPKT